MPRELARDDGVNGPGWIQLVHTAATLALGGLIWYVQLVHYPLLPMVGGLELSAYEPENVRRTWTVAGPLMAVEAFTGLLLIRQKPLLLRPALFWSGGFLLALLWLSTFFVQLPLHRTLYAGFDASAFGWLIATNWFRTIGWTIRGGLVLYALRWPRVSGH